MFTSNRDFRMWDFNVSHSQLLIRSPRSRVVSTNIDIVFWGVIFVRMPAVLNGIEMAECSEDEIASLDRGLVSKSAQNKVFSVRSGINRYVIICAGVKVLENELDIFDSSLEYFAATDPTKDLGKLLFRS